MMEYEEFGRSGTAPSKSTKGNAPSQRTRPKTRGVVTGTGASELADLNMSLKMDKGSNSGAGYYEYSEDPIEDFQSVVDNWEKARRTKQGAERECATALNSAKANCAYTRGDPVSAAYSSQFRTTTKTSSPKGSPRASSSKARAVAELHAAYGINDQSHQSSQPRRRSSSGSVRKSRTAETSCRGNAESVSSSATNPRPSSRGTSRASASAGISKKEVISSSEPPSAAEVRSAQSRARASNGGGEGWRAATEKSNPVSSSVKSAERVLEGSGAGVSASVVPARRPVAPSAPASPAPQPPPGPSVHTTAHDPTAAKTSFRRRQEQQYRVSSSGTGSGRRVDDGSNESPIHTSSSTPTSLSSSTGAVIAGPPKRESEILDMVSPCIEVDDDGSELAENERFAATSYGDGESQRPQSRKLYMGTAGTPSNPANRAADLKDSAGGDGGGSVLRAPRSAGALSRHRMSPEMAGAGGLDKKGDGGAGAGDGKKMERTSSFTAGFKQGSHWKDTSVNYDDRPPSRQKSAFPTHLADVDSGISQPRVLREKKHAFSDVSTEGPPAVDTTASATTSLGSSPRSFRQTNGSSELVIEGPNDRPPSRQKIRAQNLFDMDSDYDAQQDNDGPANTQKATDNGFVSPLLTPTESSLSMGGIEIFDNGPDVDVMTPQPRYQQSRTAEPSRSPFEPSSLGPMYDPAADGFAQLDRSSTAPFKIRVRPFYNANANATI
jgi:hypothetical protein